MKHTFLTAFVSLVLLVAISHSAVALEAGFTSPREANDSMGIAALLVPVLGSIPGCCLGTLCAPVIGPFSCGVLGTVLSGLAVFAASFVSLTLLLVALCPPYGIVPALILGCLFAIIGLFVGAAVGAVIGLLFCFIGCMIGAPFGACVGAFGLGALGAIAGIVASELPFLGVLSLIAAVVALLLGLCGAGLGSCLGGALGLCTFPISGPLGGAVFGAVMLLVVVLLLMGASGSG